MFNRRELNSPIFLVNTFTLDFNWTFSDSMEEWRDLYLFTFCINVSFSERRKVEVELAKVGRVGIVGLVGLKRVGGEGEREEEPRFIAFSRRVFGRGGRGDRRFAGGF